MSLSLDKSTWKRVSFGDVVYNVNETVRNADAAGIDRVIAMEHLDPGELRIQRWGSIEDGTTFTRRSKHGQTLFGKRRAYQRKVAYAEFDAICSGDIYTFEADQSQMLGEFLPFLVQSNEFFDHALDTSAGSISPRTNWRELANFEFDLPPLDEQKRIADLLWRLEAHRTAIADMRASLDWADEVWLGAQYSKPEVRHVSVADLIADGVIRLLTGPFGSTLAASEYTDNGVPVIQPSFIVDGRLTVDEKSFVSGDTAARLRRWQVREGDIVFMRKRDVTRSAIVTPDERGWILGSDCILVRIDDSRLNPSFVRAMLRSPSARAELLRRAPGTAMPGINERSLSALRLPVQDSAGQRRVVLEWQVFEHARLAAVKEASCLVELRSSILAHIFGGC